MLTDASTRPFPYVRYAFKTREPKYYPVLGAVVIPVLVIVLVRALPNAQGAHRILLACFLAVALSGVALYPARLGFFDVVPNRVRVRHGVTSVWPRVSLNRVGTLVGSVAIVVLGVTVSHNVGWAEVWRAGPAYIGLGPGMIALGAWSVWDSVRTCLRSITMTPEAITYRMGPRKITLAWDELGDAIATDDIVDHFVNRNGQSRADRNFYVPGAKVVVPPDRLSESGLPRYVDEQGVARLLLQTDHFRVEPSALLTAILAMRDHRELRPMLGTPESKQFFVGPSWRERRGMYRYQQWWPGGGRSAGDSAEQRVSAPSGEVRRNWPTGLNPAS